MLGGAGITVGALLVQQMLGSDDLSGPPTALCTLVVAVIDRAPLL